MIKEYIKSARPKLSVFLLFVILGTLFSVNFNLKSIEPLRLVLILLSFQMFYSSIYIINDIIDYKIDRLSTRKKHRPIASGKISKKNALIFAITLILFSIAIGIFISQTLVMFEIIFLVYSFFYSNLFKKIPYIDTLSNSVSHVLRFIMGMALYGGIKYYYLIISILMIDFAFLLIKRNKEIKSKEKVSRPIGYYNKQRINLLWIVIAIILLALFIISQDIEKLSIGVLFLAYVIGLILYETNKNAMRLMEKFAD